MQTILANIRSKSKTSFFLVAVILLTISRVSYAQTTYYSRASGTWTNRATWSLTSGGGQVGAGVYPVAGDNVIIERGYTVTVAANAECSTITFGTATTGNLGTVTVNSGISLSVSGAITLNIPANASVNASISGAGSVLCSSLIIGNNTAPTTNNTTRTHTLASTVSSIVVYTDLVINSHFASNNRIRNGIFTLTSGTLDIRGSIITNNTSANNTSAFTLGNSSPYLILGGEFPFNITSTGTSNITLNGTGATVEYNRAGNQDVRAGAYTSLICSGSGTKTLQGAISVINLQIAGSSILDAHQFQITGNAAGTMDMAAGTGLIIGDPVSTTANLFPSSFTSANISLDNTSTVTYTANANQNVSGVPTYGNLSILSGSTGNRTRTLQANTTIDGNLTIEGGTYTSSLLPAGMNLTVNGVTNIGNNGIFNDGTTAGTNIFAGLLTIDNGGQFINANNPGFEFRGGIINNGTFTKSGTGLTTFSTNAQTVGGSNGLTFSGGNVTLSSDITVTNQTTVTVSGILNGGNGFSAWINDENSTLNYNNATQPMGTGNLTATASGNTVNYGLNAGQAVKSTEYYNLTLSNAGAKATSGVTVNGTLSMEGTATASNPITYGSDATLQYNTSNTRTTTNNEWPATFNGTGGVILVSAPQITLNGAKVLGLNSSLTIRSGASLSTGNNDLTFGGNFVNNGGTFTAGSSNITIANTGLQSIDGLTTTGAVNITKTGGTATLQGNVNGSDLAINGAGGTINLGTGLTHTFSGIFNFTNGTISCGSSVLRLGGNISSTGGNFTSGTGTVEFYGGIQAIPGFTYYNLTLSGGSTKTLNNETRVNGNLGLTNSILALGSYNLTLGVSAAISGTFSATNMINIGNSSLIKEGNVNTDFIINLPIGNGTAYTPVNIAGFTATVIAPSSWISVRSDATPATGIPGTHPLNRHWITSCSGMSGSILADISFTYVPADIPSGGTAGLYEIYYKPSTGEWGKPGGAGAAGSNPL